MGERGKVWQVCNERCKQDQPMQGLLNHTKEFSHHPKSDRKVFRAIHT